MVLWLDAQAQDQHPGSRAVLITLLLNTKKESDFFPTQKEGYFFHPDTKCCLLLREIPSSQPFLLWGTFCENTTFGPYLPTAISLHAKKHTLSGTCSGGKDLSAGLSTHTPLSHIKPITWWNSPTFPTQWLLSSPLGELYSQTPACVPDFIKFKRWR